MSYRAFLSLAACALLLVACNTRGRGTGGPLPTGDTGAPPPMGDGGTEDTSTPPDTSAPPDTGAPTGCTGPGDCNDGISCTDDLCEAGTCRNVPNDGFCETGMTCELGVGCTGLACDESPCRLLAPQCGCPTGEGCYPNGGTSRACMAAGTAVEGSSCSALNDCAPGLVCAGLGVASCLKTCETDSECPGTTNLCLLEYEDGVTSLCTGTCDPIAQTGCPSGAMCRVYQEDSGARRGFTTCWGPIGAGTQGSSCIDSEDCARGYVCGGTICHKWCREGFTGDCPTGTTCTGLTDAISVGSVRYNLCM